MAKGKQTLRITSPAGGEDVIKIDKELWDLFAARAKELGVSEEQLFIAAMDNFLKSKGY